MKVRRLWPVFMVLSVLIVLLAWTASPGLAQDQDSFKPPPEGVSKDGKVELDNVLDPKSPNYDPDQRYGREGTRFGPPGDRSGDTPFDGGELDWTRKDYYGTGVYGAKGVYDTWAFAKISTTLDLEETDDILYMPAFMAPEYCRLESVGVYTYNGSSTDRYWKVWEHTSSGTGEGFIYSTLINPTFTSRYVNSGYVAVSTDRANGPVFTWTTYLYDFIDEEWDVVVTGYTGNSHSRDGWDIWESFDLDSPWPDLPELRSYSLRVYVASLGDYTYVTSTYGQEEDSTGGGFPYDKSMNSNYYDWDVSP